jgi:hypothetical protein
MSTASEDITESMHRDADATSDEDSVLCQAHGLRLWRADDYGWLVRTGADATGDVYACIDESGDEFELMELVGGFRWTTHASLHLAVERLLLRAPISADVPESAPRAARGAEELTVATELTHVIHGWLAGLEGSVDEEAGSHRSIAQLP